MIHDYNLYLVVVTSTGSVRMLGSHVLGTIYMYMELLLDAEVRSESHPFSQRCLA